MTPTTVQLDPEFAGLLSPLTDQERHHLANQVRKYGCEPLVVWRGHNILLDGHHRKQICDDNHIPYEIREIDLPDRAHAVQWIIFRQWGRRNLKASQRAMLAAKLAKLFPSPAKSGKPRSIGKASERAARVLKVSPRLVEHAAKVFLYGSDGLQAAVTAGAVAASSAAAIVGLPKSDQDKAAAGGKAAVAKAARGAGEQTPEPPTTDEVGEPLPDRRDLREAFARRVEITHLMSDISNLKSRALKAAVGKDPVYARFDVSGFQCAMENARRALKAVRPHAVCPYCQGGERGGGANCKACHGAGWLGEFDYHAVPRDMRRDKK